MIQTEQVKEGIENTIITDETVVNTTTMAVILGVTARRVQQLVQDGTIKTAEKGKLCLIEGVHAYIDLLTNREKSAEEKNVEMIKAQAEANLKVAKASMAQLQADELKGKMHRSEDVKAFTQTLVDTVKQGLLSLPGRMSVELSLCDTAEECSVIVKDTVKELLRELSDFEYDPAKYEELVRERENLAEKPEDDEDDI